MKDKIFPFLETIKNYNLEKARADIVAGITVAIVASPQSMAYAMIAGVEPVYGLYASILPVIIAALWGSSRYLLAGPTNAVSMVLYSSMMQFFVGGVAVGTLPEEQRLPFLFMLALLTGAIQLVFGIAKLGSFAKFISHSVMLGFVTGASLLIVIGQLKNFLGLEFPSPTNTFDLIYETVIRLGEVNYYTLTVGIATLIIALFVKKFIPKAPYALVALIVISVIGSFLNIVEKNILMSPAVMQGFPPLFIPSLELIEMIPYLFMPAVALALLASVETIAIGKSMADKRGDLFDANQELIGQGLGNMAACFSSAIAGCGSFSRSAVNFTSGARTRFAAAFSGVLTFFALILLGSFVSYIPITSLAAILMIICWNMINIEEIRHVIKKSTGDCIIFLTTLLCVFLLGLEHAIFIGILLSLILKKLNFI